ncbi:CMP-N-acetylneuraminate-beta-1,4-galactoside alpha-2,3-sialyltransferase-like isoform X2 [Lytechinus variegatus]|nr:CMP-N-acetylneuraminate-beta-1,4-galactoside alpha-2,3-sialyltransferase-like isoform X2 [Lytechinus variegatus]
MNTVMFRTGVLRKIYILFIILATVLLFYFVRPLQDTYISSVKDGDMLGKKDGMDYDDQAESGILHVIISYLRSLIGLGLEGSSGISKTKIVYDSHARRLVDNLEMRIFQNKTNSSEVTGIKPPKKTGINSLSYHETNITDGSRSQCIPGKTRDRMLNLFGNRYDVNIHPFIGAETEVSSLVSLPPPFGFKKLESVLKKAVSVINKSDFSEITSKSCSRCVVVGNGGVMKDSSMGAIIDDFDVVIRLNDAPTITYEKDVGSKTTIRMAYPESSFQSAIPYKGHWLYVIVIFKQTDLEWISNVAAGKKVPSSLRFWKSVARSVPKPADEFRIFNPHIIQETAELVGMKIGNGKVGKNVPTTGSFAISMATRLCDEVSVAGFGYDESKPLHYYDKQQIKVVKNSWTHNINIEKKWLLKLVQQGIVHDLTGGIK